uniref:Stress-induced-phosphoprotein 1 n=1 Tax=Corethrella appendiculata TaxID=1370023 RepID=U5EX44_9DIPT
MEKANALKEAGNKALSAGNYNEAITAYTQAIELDPVNHILYSNRSAAYAKLENYENSLKDAEKCVQLNATFSKGYSRKGLALTKLGRLEEAFEAYNAGLQQDPNSDVLKQGVNEILSIFQEQFRKNNFKFNSKSSSKMDVDPPKSPSPPPKSSTSSAGSSSSQQQKQTNNKMETEEDLPENKKLAKKEKELGNASYKKKDFDTALKHYNAALAHDPSDITFHNNIAAVYFEQQDFQKCIAECEKAVEVGRENRADYKLIAKSFARIGNAYKKLEDYKSAKTYYEKSLSEHRTPDIKSMLSETEKLIKEQERKAYIDPEKAEQEKEKGNEYFKNGDYSSAVKHYSEAILRNPDDPKLYSNRAACYTKLAAFDLGLKDCDMCVKLDEKFIKGWVRKGKILQVMKKPSEALSAYQKAIEIDPSNAEALEGYRTCTVAVQSDPKEVWKKAMNDPEVQQILKDPAMRVILEQMQTDPKAVQEHLKNPQVASKIQKLYESGIIQIY